MVKKLMGELRQREVLSRALVVNLVGGVGVQLLLLVSGVILARTLGPTNRGNMALLTVVSAVAWQLGGLGIPYALTYAAARSPGSAIKSWALMRRPIVIQAIVAAVVAGIVLAALTHDRPNYVKLGGAMTAFAIVGTVYQRCGLGLLQGLRKFVSFNVLRASSNIVFSSVAAALWITGDRNFFPYAAAWAISQSIVAPIVVWTAKRAADESAIRDEAPPSKEALQKFGRKSLFGGDPPVESYRLDQAVVAIFLAPAALGYYVAALAFTNLPRFVAQSFALLATPVVAGRDGHREAVTMMWRFFWLAIPFYMTVIVALWLGTPLLVKGFFGGSFTRSVSISRILLAATALYCARRVLADAARGAGYPGIGSVAELVAFFAVLPLFGILVPLFGLNGVAWALIASSIIALAVLVIGLRRSTATGLVPESWDEIHTVPIPSVDARAPARA